MTKIAFLRHAPTEWNRAGRLQGRTDVPLDQMSLDEIAQWTLPAEMRAWRVVSSPLTRARDTAAHFTGRTPDVDERLIETDWGDWEGRDLNDIRETYGDGVAHDGKAGLDFAAPNGESPRQVQKRLDKFLGDVSRDGTSVLAVTHKGVIRAAYALATDWDMMQKPKTKLQNLIQVFDLSERGVLAVDRLNVSLGEP